MTGINPEKQTQGMHEPAVNRIPREHWGAAIQLATGIDISSGIPKLIFDTVDTGVNAFAEEVFAILKSPGPIQVSAPIQFARAPDYKGPLFDFQNGGDEYTIINMEGDDQRTEINLGDITHSSTLTFNEAYDYSTNNNFTINNVEGDTNTTNITVTNNPDGGGGGGGGGQPQEQKLLWGKIVGGSGANYDVDTYPEGPFLPSATNVSAICMGATTGWTLPWEDLDLWVKLEFSAGQFFFLPPPIPTFNVTLDTMGQDSMIVNAPFGSVFAAKPYELRVNPFDGETVNWNGTDVGYDYQGQIVEREATVGLVSENQRIIPEYIEHAANAIHDGTLQIAWAINGTGVNDDNGDEIGWYDINVAGRAWSGVCA